VLRLEFDCDDAAALMHDGEGAGSKPVIQFAIVGNRDADAGKLQAALQAASAKQTGTSSPPVTVLKHLQRAPFATRCIRECTDCALGGMSTHLRVQRLRPIVSDIWSTDSRQLVHIRH
jgi:hypothetical protein